MAVMPLCVKFFLLVGQSEDGTEEMLASLNIPNLFLVPSLWNDNIRKGGEVLAEETNKALGHLDNDADWYIYIQGDEAIHEDDYPALHNAMSKYKNDPSIDGLLFDYLHFYGSYDYIATSSKWYKKEVHIIKPK